MSPKRLPGESYQDYMTRIQKQPDHKNVVIPNNTSLTLTEQDYDSKKNDEKKKQSKNLAISFKYLTENKDYNFNYFKKNKTAFDGFVTRLNSTLIKITSLQVKDLGSNPFTDKFPFKNLYEGVYVNSNKVFENTEEVISVELGSKSHERIILFYDGNKITGDNILYVLLFDMNFNHPAYRHGKKMKR